MQSNLNVANPNLRNRQRMWQRSRSETQISKDEKKDLTYTTKMSLSLLHNILSYCWGTEKTLHWKYIRKILAILRNSSMKDRTTKLRAAKRWFALKNRSQKLKAGNYWKLRPKTKPNLYLFECVSLASITRPQSRPSSRTFFCRLWPSRRLTSSSSLTFIWPGDRWCWLCGNRIHFFDLARATRLWFCPFESLILWAVLAKRGNWLRRKK